MYYRRKIVLALLQAFGGELEKLRFQKLLFLFSQRQESKAYDFVPHKLGCYSYSARADLMAMARKNIVIETESHFKCREEPNYFNPLKEHDLKILVEVKDLFFGMNANSLMEHIRVNYPYWTTKSETEEKLVRVQNNPPVLQAITLFTIGYEGISLEEYLNRLIQNDVKVLVDVRHNPLSMKFGFNKNQLIHFCQDLGLQYVHLPQLGIRSSQRRTLNSQSDYNNLFENFRETTLAETEDIQREILNLLIKKRRVALTCFEADICQCHRKPLAEAIQSLPDFTFQVKHI